MGLLIGLSGVVAVVVAGMVGFFALAGGGRRARTVVAVVGLLCLGAFVLWGLGADDGQPWAVWLGRRSGGNTDEVTDGPVGALLGRTLLNAVGVGLLLSWALVTVAAAWRRPDAKRPRGR
jgi:hypothetical protein